MSTIYVKHLKSEIWNICSWIFEICLALKPKNKLLSRKNTSLKNFFLNRICRAHTKRQWIITDSTSESCTLDIWTCRNKQSSFFFFFKSDNMAEIMINSIVGHPKLLAYWAISGSHTQNPIHLTEEIFIELNISSVMTSSTME